MLDGERKYPGLKWHEANSIKSYELIGYAEDKKSPVDYFVFSPPRTSFVLQQYDPKYWAGIDCSGLVQRSVNKADKLEILGASSTIPMLDTKAVYSQELIMNCADQCSGDYVFKLPYDAQNEQQTVDKIRKGDFVGYERHISLVYSERSKCAPVKKKKGTITSCDYNIIHAYGGDNYIGIIDGEEKKLFSRKVLVTPHNITETLSKPSGFGRIKLWN